jgi:methyl-accepting chemotaxis protein
VIDVGRVRPAGAAGDYVKISNIRIGTRMGIAFGIVLLMMGAVIMMGMLRLAQIGSTNDRMIEKDLVKADAANLINATTRANARRTMELFLAADAGAMAPTFDQIAANKKIIDEALVTLERLIYLPEGRALLGQLTARRGAYVKSFTRVGALLREGSKDAAIELMKNETLPALDAMQQPIDALTALQKQIVLDGSAEVKGHIQIARSVMLILGSCAGVIGTVLAWWITRSITGPLNVAVQVANTVARGDLTSRIDASAADETGQLLAALKRMNASLLDIVGRVRSGTDSIATASGQIAAGNLDLSSRTEEQASALEETASSMEELTSTVKQNADNAWSPPWCAPWARSTPRRARSSTSSA